MPSLDPARLLIEKELQQLGGCSKNSLRNVLGVLSKHGALRADMETSARNRKRSMQIASDQASHAATPYGPLLQIVDLAGFEWEIVNPLALLYHLSSVAQDFGTLLSGIIEANGAVPLIIIC